MVETWSINVTLTYSSFVRVRESTNKTHLQDGFVRKKMPLKKYWFEFDLSKLDSAPPGVLLGCGVSAYNREDALKLLKDCVFKEVPLPPINTLIEDIDISSLDKNHVLPNMGIPIRRGVWFPLGYE